MNRKRPINTVTHPIFYIQLLLVILFPYKFSQAAASNNEPFPVKKSNLSTVKTTKISCNFGLTTLHYEINIDPINIPTKLEKSSGETLESIAYGIVSALTIIRASVNYNNCSNPQNLITLTPRDCIIDLEKVKIRRLNGVPPNNLHKSPNYKNVSEICTKSVCNIELNDTLSSGDLIELYIPYTIELRREVVKKSWQGLYYYKQPEVNSSESLFKYYPLHAKYMFPALNEDQLEKATFRISVARYEEDGFIAISNMDIENTSELVLGNVTGWVKDDFEESPPLALDQVIVMVLSGFCNYSVSDSSNGRTRNVNVWVAEKPNSWGSGNPAYTAMEIMKMVINFEDFFNGTEYPLKKLDFVGVPWLTIHMSWNSNLGFMAYENGEVSVILDENEPMEPTRWKHNRISLGVAFQWVGGMVSPRPFLNAFGQLDTLSPLVGLTLYVWKMVYSVGHEELDPDAAETLLLQMLEDVLSRKIIISAVNDFYMPTMKWKTALPVDFYNALQRAIDFHNSTHLLPSSQGSVEKVTIEEIFKTWIQHPRDYKPWIYVREVGNDSSCFSIFQRNSYFETQEDSLSIKELWWVPVKFLTEWGSTHVVWLNNETVVWSGDANATTNFQMSNWLLVNPNGRGYYHVVYSNRLLAKITDQLNKNYTFIPWKGRNDLIENQFELSKEKGAKWNVMRGALEMTRYLTKEMSVDVWKTALKMANQLQKRFWGKMIHFEPFKTYFGSLMNSILEKIGVAPIPGEDKDVPMLRSTLMWHCSKFKIPVCLKYSVDLMTDWMRTPEVDPFSANDISLELREQLWCAAVENKTDDSSMFHFLLDQLISIKNDSDRYRRPSRAFAGALMCSTNDTLLTDLLYNQKLEEGTPNLQYVASEVIPITVLSRRPDTMAPVVYEFAKKNLLEGKKPSSSYKQCLWQLEWLPPNTLSPALKDDLLKFLDEHHYLFSADLDILKYVKETFGNQSKELGNDNFWSSTESKIIDWVNTNTFA